MAHLFYKQGWPMGFLVAGRRFIGVPLNDKNNHGKKGGPITATAVSRFYEKGELLQISADGSPEEEDK
ncbi:MAG: hypothetical protein UV36_C0008G0008 [Parcubacteria group bacterium GW2011_GWC2_42_6]|nr:MAG: hypothetical protein UV36_C0008G0008 [Parcubacteria group bacterium GW2011_GWC2_42_6]KKT76731.1 MAG: hypothetical protein UW72_C0002G0033 [Parcubacteria group bacterium GW2011_GWF2_44_7]